MGPVATSTVYVVELQGLLLALQILFDIYKTGHRPGICAIFTDNQAALRATQNPKCPSGQYILAKVLYTLDQLRTLHWDIQLRKIPAHVGVPGNV